MTDRAPLATTAASLARFGVPRRSATAVIRAKCLDCAGTWHEVKLCECANCPLWPFRLGRDPWRASRELTAEQRAEAADRLRRGRGKPVHGE